MLEKPQGKTVPPASVPSLLWQEAVELTCVAIAYWVVVRLGLLMVAQPEGIASVWPASGLVLAILLIRPKRRWGKLLAVIFVTNAAGNLNGGNSMPVSLGFALANTLEAGFGAWVLTALCGSKITFERIREVVILLFVAVVTNAITAMLGAAVSVLAFDSLFTNSWAVWWAADGLGIMLITPLIVSWVKDRWLISSACSCTTLESVLLSFTLAAITWLCFSPFTMPEWPLIGLYVIFPISFWIAYRLSLRCLISSLFLCSAIAIWGTLHGFGSLALDIQSRTEHLAFLQIFLATLICSGLILNSTVNGRKRAEKALQVSEAKFRSIIDTSPVPLVSIDDRQRVTFLNPAFIQTFGYTLNDVPTLPDWWPKAFPDPDYRHWVAETWLARVEKMKRSDGDFQPMEAIIRCKDRTRKTVLATAASLDGSFYETHLVVLYDVTELKQAEQMLMLSREHVRRLVQNLETVREEEHKHFANELHDELGQILTAIKIDLATVAAECPSGQLKEKMDGVQNLLTEGVLGVHSLCRKLRPGALDDLGLEGALTGLVEDWKRYNPAECDFCADINEEVLTDKIRTAVFRITQEALTNVSCHAHASKVWINLVADEQTLRFSVADNGCGMQPGTESRLTSFGLLHMRERLEALDGELHIESSPGKGTRIEGTIPLQKKG